MTFVQYQSDIEGIMFKQFIHPFSMILSGPSGCGKTTFLRKLCENREWLIDGEIKKILLCYSEINAVPHIKDKHIELFQGVPEYIENSKNERMLVILDDLMNDSDNVKISELFTKGSHHRNISIVLITQNIFHRGSHSRDISLNTKYFIIFKNPRDQQQFQFFARQIYPENPKDLVRIYKEVTSISHSYLLIDLTQGINDNLRVRTDIFNKFYCTVFCKVKNNELEAEEFEGEQAYAIYS